MATILDRHTAICVPPETQFMKFVNDNRDLQADQGSRSPVHEDFVARWKAYDRFGDFGIPIDAFVTEFMRGEASFQNAFHVLLSVCTSTSGKTLCIEKSPNHIFSVETLNNWYPQSRFLNMIRDGRDVAISLRNAKFSAAPLRFGCLTWNQYQAKARALRRQFGARWLDIRMEDLVRDPSAVVPRVMEFFGSPFEPDQLVSRSPRHLFPEREREWKADSQKPIDSQKIEQFRTQATLAEIRMMDLLLNKNLRALGYPLSGVPAAKPLDRLKLWAYVTAFSIANTTIAVRIRKAIRSRRRDIPATKNAGREEPCRAS